MNQKVSLIPLVVSLALLLCVTGALAQGVEPQNPQEGMGTAFTYQGQLKNASGPVTGSCDFQFGLWDSLANPTGQIGTTQSKSSVALSNGLFTVQLDFGTSAFTGAARWLQIAVGCPAGSGAYTTLSPREPLTAAPYALYSANADLLDGQHAAAFQQHAQNVVVVAKSGGDFTSIQTAIDSTTNATASNHYLVYVAPGTYTESVVMKRFVDIEGAGELTTKITYTGTDVVNVGTVRGASDAELRFLTVENTGGAFYAVAIYNSNAAPRLTDVTASTSGGTSNFGVYNNNSSSAMMTNVTASASGGTNNYGMLNSYSSPTMTNVTASASGGENNRGVHNSFSSATMTNVTASASGGTENRGVYNSSSSPAMTNVTASASGGTSYNAGVENYSSSPAMTNVTVRASGGTNSYGVHNSYSSPAMTNVTVSASGAMDNYGVYNIGSSPQMNAVTASATVGGHANYGVCNISNSSPTMTNLTVSASGTSQNYGVWNANSSSTIQSSVITASGGSPNDGIHSIAASGSFTITINNSRVTGSTSTLYQESYYTTKAGASQLAGGGAFGGAYVCAASYNGNYTALNAACQ
jgi:hypothetical protein